MRSARVSPGRVRGRWLVVSLVAIGALVVASCSDDADPERVAGGTESSTTPETTTSTTAPTTTVSTTTSTTLPPGVTERPDWLGTRVLPTTPQGFGEVQPTPLELQDRRFVTPDHLPPPDTKEFRADVAAVPDDVAARSTWQAACPVSLAELRYVTLTFWGFDGRAHTGELLIHRDTAQAMVAGFRSLYESRFPIEEMRITRADELDAPPTGDGNNTESFVCRPVTGSSNAQSWSQHAYGRAVDINPFHNPYQKGSVVIPELASAYLDRGNLRPGMLTKSDVAAFEDAGWGWGGEWSSLKDYQHLSANGR